MRNAYKILDGISGGKRPPGRPRVDGKILLELDIRETGWEVVDRFHLSQVRDQWKALVNTVMSIWVP
jgi:hypothetical protein